MDKDVEKHVKSCHSCQLVGAALVLEPTVRPTFPNAPWEDLAIDLMGPLPNGQNLLVVVDYYSRFFEVAIMKSTTSFKVIMELERMFSVHGIPLTIKTDNGTQFVSDEFQAFLKQNMIIHRTTTPLWPQANGEVERQNRTLLKTLKIAQSEGKDMKRELYRFLLAYRSTPHQTTGVSPSELLFGRTIRTKLPTLSKVSQNELLDHFSYNDKSVPMYRKDESVRERDAERKLVGKEYADEKRNACESSVKVGDDLLLKQKKLNKLSTEFEKTPYKVIEKQGSQVTIQSPLGKTVKRNVTFTKPLVRDGQSLDTCVENQNESVEANESSERPKRAVRMPERLKDFVVK